MRVRRDGFAERTVLHHASGNGRDVHEGRVKPAQEKISSPAGRARASYRVAEFGWNIVAQRSVTPLFARKGALGRCNAGRG